MPLGISSAITLARNVAQYRIYGHIVQWGFYVETGVKWNSFERQTSFRFRTLSSICCAELNVNNSFYFRIQANTKDLICKQTDSDQCWHAHCIMRYTQVRGSFYLEISTSDNRSQGKDFG